MTVAGIALELRGASGWTTRFAAVKAPTLASYFVEIDVLLLPPRVSGIPNRGGGGGGGGGAAGFFDIVVPRLARVPRSREARG
jgi:hypothetical protein